MSTAHYAPIEPLTCAYFSAVESASAPCELSYDYECNGNLTFKSDVGELRYDAPLHPHAVTGEATATGRFSYDAVSNQIARPGGTTVRYTPFDLPERITEGASTVTFAYDGDQQRLRKTTPDEETLYFGDLYERVTDAATGRVEHRYHVRSPERVAAIVTRGGAEPGTRYVHVDHLGSVDVLTDEDGAVVERRSYDPFGQRRNPVWGRPSPASFASTTTRGFTGHEGDDEVGLVNMKGRVYDPRVGRLLTTDPIMQAPLSGQSWNPYSYVRNSPLSYVDPSGFREEPQAPGMAPTPGIIGDSGVNDPCLTGCVVSVRGAPRVEGSREAAEVGAVTAPVDVGTTGTSSGYAPQPVATEPEHAGLRGVAPLVGPGMLGVAEGTRDIGVGIGRLLVLNTGQGADGAVERRIWWTAGALASGSQQHQLLPCGGARGADNEGRGPLTGDSQYQSATLRSWSRMREQPAAYAPRGSTPWSSAPTDTLIRSSGCRIPQPTLAETAMKCYWTEHDPILVNSTEELLALIDDTKSIGRPTMMLLEHDNGRTLVIGLGSPESVLTFVETDGTSFHSVGDVSRSGVLRFWCRDQLDDFML
ncbi:RHS repeat-associated core domain-containing protein [Sorangium sp. So ce131]